MSKLVEVNKTTLDGKAGMNIYIANLGWIGVVPPCTTMVRVLAPNQRVRVVAHETMGLPWGDYQRPKQNVAEVDLNVDDDDGEYTDEDYYD